MSSTQLYTRRGYLSVCLTVYLSNCVSVCLPVCLFICLSIYLCVCLSTCLSVCLPVWLSVSLSICVSACVSVCLSACLPVCQSHLTAGAFLGRLQRPFDAAFVAFLLLLDLQRLNSRVWCVYESHADQPNTTA